MNRMIATGLGLVLLVMAGGGCHAVNGKPLTNAEQADQLAQGVMLASGANTWKDVRSVAFDFVVHDGKDLKLRRHHLWNVKEGTDTVSVGEKTVTVDLMKPNMDDAEQTDAFKAWTNDSYWLLAPLKLFDGGVTRQYLGRREVAGKSFEVLGLSFKGVGMTPSDQYNMYVDPYTSLLSYWDYMPNADTKMLATWEQYRHVDGLKLATYHQMGTKTITIENLSVASE
jgi:hypothetical protein